MASPISERSAAAVVCADAGNARQQVALLLEGGRGVDVVGDGLLRLLDLGFQEGDVLIEACVERAGAVSRRLISICCIS